MIDKFVENLGEKLADRWAAATYSPAFIFWLGGLAAWSRHHDAAAWLGDLQSEPEITQAAMVVAALAVVIGSAIVVQRLDLSVIRWLEGYWPAVWPLTRWRAALLRRHASRLVKDEQRYAALVKGDVSDLSASELEELTTLDWRLMQTPASPVQRMPTALGNVLRAAELRPQEKYGLESTVCYPRLWLVLPEGTKKDLAQARSAIDTAARACCWSVIFMIWSVWIWWAAPVGLAGAWVAYRWTLEAAGVYASLLDSAFDIHRNALYAALRWPLPATPAEEHASGQELTTYLWRGSDSERKFFDHPKGQSGAT
jgi:hypothetical protein